jgi:hypothetical protein
LAKNDEYLYGKLVVVAKRTNVRKSRFAAIRLKIKLKG